MSKISDLSDGGSLQSTDFLVAVRSGGNVKVQADGNLDLGTVTLDGLTVAQGANATATTVRIENTDTSITAAQDVNRIEFYTNDASASGTGVSAEISQVAINAGNQYALAFSTYNTSLAEAVRIDHDGNVLVGTNSATFTSSGRKCFEVNGTTNSIINLADTSGGSKVSKFYIHNDAGNSVITYLSASGVDQRWYTGSTEKMRLTDGGTFLVGKTSTALNTEGQVLAPTFARFTRSGAAPVQFNRTTNDGDIVIFYKDGASVGSISTVTGYTIFNGQNNTGFLGVNGTAEYGFDGVRFYPNTDNARDLGLSSLRWDDIYATNSTIITSDRNEKQDIEELTDAERRVAVAAKGLLRKFRWIDSVEAKGDEARIHFGIIAQDLQAAFEAEGLHAGRYAMFTHTTWTDEETGEERSRMGVRYSELLAFIIAAL